MGEQFQMDVPKGELQEVLDDLKKQPQFKIVSQTPKGDVVVLIVEDTSAPAAASGGGGGGPATGGGGVGGAGGGGGSSVPGTVATFSSDEWNQYCTVLGKKESGNDYSIVNPLGFAGRWQFGRLALIDGGYVNSGGSGGGAPAAASSWTGKDGISSREAWLANKAVQDAAMVVYTQSHYKSLLNKGGLSAGSSKPRVAGLLAAAHLMGVGGAMDMVNGTVKADANGTTTTNYYAMLSKAFGGSGVLEA